VVALACACQRATPIPDEVARHAARERLALSASAVAAAQGTIPLGARPALLEVPFQLEPGGRYCAPVIVGACSLDVVGDDPATDVVTVTRGVPSRFVGWAADRTTNTVPRVVQVTLVGERIYAAPAVRLTPRSDVARSLGDPELLHSGYDVLAVLRAVLPGTYAVKVVQVNTRGDLLLCDTRRKLVVE
jgi:hypothetical protein